MNFRALGFTQKKPSVPWLYMTGDRATPVLVLDCSLASELMELAK